MHSHYDPAIDAMLIEFTSSRGKRVRTIEVRPGVNLDFDAANHLVALELLDASDHIPRETLLQLPPAAIELTLTEAAKESGHAPGTLRVLINQGRLMGRKRGRDWIVTRAALWNYLESRSVRGPKTTVPRRTREAMSR
jgi:uncharacterized protein YuzE